MKKVAELDKRRDDYVSEADLKLIRFLVDDGYSAQEIVDIMEAKKEAVSRSSMADRYTN